MAHKSSQGSVHQRESAIALTVIALVIIASLRLGHVEWRQIILVILFVPMILLAVRHGQKHHVDAHRALLHQATHDMLTGLPNRVLFRERLYASRQLASHYIGRFAVALIDLDGFKAVNDQHGHLAGDALLQTVAERLRDTLRATDTVARFGGDEFALILESVAGMDRVEILAWCEQIGAVLAKPYPLTGRNGRFVAHISASIGIALGAEHSDERLIQAADKALYQAKAAGKNGCAMSDASSYADASRD